MEVLNKMDFEILDKQLPVITIDFDSLKIQLTQAVADYKSLVVTEDQLSLCKEKQRELAGLRNKIDRYRKDVKNEMSKPIVEFEDKCKQLIKIVEEAEKSLKEGIKVFDDKKREEKRAIAEELKQGIIEQHELKPKYAEQLTILNKYMNLTAKASEVREDLEQRVFILLGEQNKEKEMLEIIQDTIDNANKTIKSPMSMADFQRLIDRGLSSRDIIAEINMRAEQIREAENPPTEPGEPQQEASNPEPETPVCELSKQPTNDEKIYFVELRFVQNYDGIAKLSELLKANGFEYTVLRKGKVN